MNHHLFIIIQKYIEVNDNHNNKINIFIENALIFFFPNVIFYI